MGCNLSTACGSKTGAVVEYPRGVPLEEKVPPRPPSLVRGVNIKVTPIS